MATARDYRTNDFNWQAHPIWWLLMRRHWGPSWNLHADVWHLYWSDTATVPFRESVL